MNYQSVWGLNELGEIVVASGTGTTNVIGYMNQDNIPANSSGKVVFANAITSVIDSAGNKLDSAISTYNPAGSVGRVETKNYSVNPSATSNLVYVGQRLQMTYNSSAPITTGGWVSAREDALTFPLNGLTIDKALVQLAQINVSGTGTIDKLLGHESEIATISTGTTINSYSAYYVPNLSGVANIGNITTFYAFANDHTNAKVKSAGPIVNAALVEYSPPYHPGLVANRYYSAPHDTIAANAVAANVIYFIPVLVPHRTTVLKLGFTVTTLGAGSARLAIYRAKGGVPEILQIDAGTISVSTTGDKEISISQQLDAGTYYLAINFSVACSVNWHQGSQAIRQGMFGSNTSTQTGAGQECGGYFAYAFGAFPSVAGVMSYNAQQAEPHVWFRV